jgi:ferric-dicitrate binding protein FerR (iron transport regulator)
MVTGIAEQEGSKPIIRYWTQDQGSKRRAEHQPRAAKYQAFGLRKWASAMAAIVLGLAILATFWKWDAMAILKRWLQAVMYEM